ncbi:DNA-binding transcriptional repressor RpiR [Roseovarius albus]|uniref:DNA-binding transcriptional repressor RpiR n=2 Tax=Roseovarius albus TaxID=1247867 RepID=A0A1X6ZAC6_9RHOB|nr:DNA-binding transcriptional repressor RpiR [Roseovarius albus]
MNDGLPEENMSSTVDHTPYSHVSLKLKELHPQLPRVLKVAASYMLEHPGDVATLSMRKVADNAGISLPNFSRLAKMLGYASYGELRDVYREQVQHGDMREYHLRAETLQKSGRQKDADAKWEDFRAATHNNITAIFDGISPDYFAEAAQVLNAADRVYLVGMQASSCLSAYAYYLGIMVSGKFRLVRGDGGILADPVAEISEKDAMIVVSQRPCARSSVDLAILARERGAKVIAITDSPAAPIAINSDFSLLSPNDSPLFFESYVGATILIEALIGFFVTRQTKNIADRVSQIEDTRKRLNEYWDQSKD